MAFWSTERADGELIDEFFLVIVAMDVSRRVWRDHASLAWVSARMRIAQCILIDKALVHSKMYTINRYERSEVDRTSRRQEIGTGKHSVQMKIKAIVYRAPGQVGVDTFELTPCLDQEILCETLYSFISPGTELRNLTTHNKNFPCIPGYSYVGRIIEVGKQVKGWREGDLISGRNQPDSLNPSGIASFYGGHASHHRCVLQGNCAPVRLPAGADPWQYVTVEVAAISWHGVSMAFPSAGESAAVVGQGLIGAFAAKWLINMGVRVVVTDLEESRLERARRWGATGTVSAKDRDAREKILSYFERGVDISVEASSSMAGCQLASNLLKNPLESTVEASYLLSELRSNPLKWPRMVYLATYTDTVQTHPGGLSDREGVLVFRPRDRKVGDRQTVIEFIRQGQLNVSDFVNEALAVEKAPEVYQNLREHPGQYSAAAFRWKD